jgi:hypothetical protein
MDRIEPVEPMDKIEPVDPILNSELDDSVNRDASLPTHGSNDCIMCPMPQPRLARVPGLTGRSLGYRTAGRPGL